jgi:hypothetical protein
MALRPASFSMDRKSTTRCLTTLLLVIAAWWRVPAQEVALPTAPNSVKFGAIGDAGTGDPPQYDIANQMTRFHARFPFDRVILLGDNIYGGQGPQDLVKKFSHPYKALLDMGVTFYATLGNHDDPVNVRYPLWNMGGARYYTYSTKNVRFFALDSNLVDRKELAWLENALRTPRTNGRSAISITRCIRMVGHMVRRSTCAWCSSRCSSPMVSTSSFLATTTFTNA